MEKKSVVGMVIAAFVAILLGSILVSIIADQIYTKTTVTSVANESINIQPARYQVTSWANAINVSTANFTLTNAPTGWKTSDCPIVIQEYRNVTTPLVANTDYVLYADKGIIQILNSSSITHSGTNDTRIDYRYCANDYINASWARTVFQLVVGFFVLGILAAGIWFVYWIMKENDIVE